MRREKNNRRDEYLSDEEENEIVIRKNYSGGVKHAGTEIILPAGPKRPMTEREAIEVLHQRIEESEMDVSISEEIDAFWTEGAYAFTQAMEERYGFSMAVPTPGFFGPTPPRVMSVDVDYKKTSQIIWGSFKIPGIDARLETEVTRKQGRIIFAIGGEIKKKYQQEVKDLANATRKIVEQRSIYRGRAIKLLSHDGELRESFDFAPQFLDLSQVNPEELTFSDEVMEQIQTSVFTPIEKSEHCRKFKIPLKRAVLFQGPFGTGKTLTAFVAARKAVENNWTFIYLDKVSALKPTLDFAKRYQPCVIFAEDIDREMGDERDEETDDILNTIDGIDGKNTEIMVILTTNEVNNIEKAMMRPGRLDAVIPIMPPDAKAARKLVQIYGRGLVDASDPLTETGKELQGQIPALIREVVERSKLFAISRMNGHAEVFNLKDEDIAKAAKGMKAHIELMKKEEVLYSDEELLGRAFVKVMSKVDLNGDIRGEIMNGGHRLALNADFKTVQ